MFEEGHETVAEDVLPVNAMLGTFSVAGKIEFASPALGGKRFPFGNGEFESLRKVINLPQSVLSDVSELVFGVDEMVAGIDIPVMLDGEGITTDLIH